MGLFDRVERRLERAVNGAFARAFKAEVQPVEIAAAMRRAMDDRAAVLGHGRTIVPNLFTVELAPSDYERLDAYSEVLSDELVASAQEHAESQRTDERTPSPDSSASGDIEAVRAAVNALPESQRAVLHLHLHEELTFEEIAEVLGTSPGAVRVRASRAYERLRKSLRGFLGRRG